MAKTCQVCEEKMSFVEGPYETQGFFMHRKCIKTFVKDPTKYGGVPEKLTSKDKRFLTRDLGEEEWSKEAEKKLELREKSKGMVLTDIDLPFGRVFWLTVQFFLAVIIVTIPIYFIFFLIMIS